VQNFAVEHPGKGLQADVRVRADVHAFLAAFENRRACVIEKTPGANQPPLSDREGARDANASDIGHARADALSGGG